MGENLVLNMESRGFTYTIMDYQEGDELPRKVAHAVQADLRTAAIDARQGFRIRLSCQRKPGFTKLAAQADQALSHRTEGERDR